MSELKIGTATSEPAAGTLKVGSTDIQEIYLGLTKIWPSAPLCPGAEEVQIGNLIWKTANTESLSGSSGDILYYSQLSGSTARDSYTNEIPVSALYVGNSNNQQYGRYYNKYAARDIIPPTGFRLPTDADFENLNSELQQLFNENENAVTSIGGGEPNFWNSVIEENYYFGRSCFNSKGVGAWQPNSTGNNNSGENGVARYWTQEQADLSGITNNLVDFRPSSAGRIVKTSGFSREYIFAPIRFCKTA
jgi:uncharacterized protein (TIGR02145 family)